MASRQIHEGRLGWLAVPGTAYLLAVFAVPLFLLLWTSLQSEAGGLSLAGYKDYLAEPYSMVVIGNTLRVACLITVICLVIGYPVGFAMARASVLVQGLMFVALILPLSVGVVVKSFAWTILLRGNGLLNQSLMALGVIDRPLRLLFNEYGLLITAVHVFLPFMVLPVFTVARQLDSRLSDAAATLGASPLYRFFRVTLPLSLPGIVAGCAFVFAMAVSMYVIPSLVVGDRFQTLPAQIARAYLFMRDRQSGAVMAAILLLIALAVVVGSTMLASRVRARTGGQSK